MTFKDIWKNKIDGVDDVLAEDINKIAEEVISLQENKAIKENVYTKKESNQLISNLNESFSETTQKMSNSIFELDNELAEAKKNINKNTASLGGLSFSISESGILTITKED